MIIPELGLRLDEDPDSEKLWAVVRTRGTI